MGAGNYGTVLKMSFKETGTEMAVKVCVCVRVHVCCVCVCVCVSDHPSLSRISENSSTRVACK